MRTSPIVISSAQRALRGQRHRSRLPIVASRGNGPAARRGGEGGANRSDVRLLWGNRPQCSRLSWRSGVSCSLGAAVAGRSCCRLNQSASADGRVVLGAEVTATFASEDPGFFNYTDYEYSALAQLPLRRWPAKLRASRWLQVLGELRVDHGTHVEPVRAVCAHPALARAPLRHSGRAAFPPTFGAFSRGTYGTGNLLIGTPLAYQYLTSLRPDALPATDRRSAADARPRLAVELPARGRPPRTAACRSSTAFAGTPACRCTASTAWSSGPARSRPARCRTRVSATTTTAARSRGACVLGRIAGAGARRFGGARRVRSIASSKARCRPTAAASSDAVQQRARRRCRVFGGPLPRARPR